MTLAAFAGEQVITAAFLRSPLEVTGSADLRAESNAGGVAGLGGALEQVQVVLPVVACVAGLLDDQLEGGVLGVGAPPDHTVLQPATEVHLPRRRW